MDERAPQKGAFLFPPSKDLMIIIPAIDLKDGKCVRLRQGKMDSSTIFTDDPSAQARTWQDMGAQRIHVVDLDGSVSGKPRNLAMVRQITDAVRVPVQLGGGIRNAETIRLYLEMGVKTAILGTVAARDPEKTKELITNFPGQLAVGIDARSGWVSVQGWTESANVKATELAARFQACPPAAFIYTDIDRDGMMAGPNIEATREFAGATSVPVILSGGVTTMDDIKNALDLETAGVMGIIIGRALYEGTIDLRQAIKLAERKDAG
jgi:phosphoribosylformimino-5-aminoimidazole carboxamide ribotide isomerase